MLIKLQTSLMFISTFALFIEISSPIQHKFVDYGQITDLYVWDLPDSWIYRSMIKTV
jgi:hypothetical protein